MSPNMITRLVSVKSDAKKKDETIPSSDWHHAIEVDITEKLTRNRRTDFRYLTFAVIDTIVAIRY